MDRSYYGSHSLTVACHPSENERRLMLRLIAFGLNANDALSFCKGLSTSEEPDLWEKNFSGDIEHWIELGQPEEKRIRKACNQSSRVTVYAYQQKSAEVWWRQQSTNLARYNRLSVFLLHQKTDELEALVSRNMALQMTIQDNQVWLIDGENTASIDIAVLKPTESF